VGKIANRQRTIAIVRQAILPTLRPARDCFSLLFAAADAEKPALAGTFAAAPLLFIVINNGGVLECTLRVRHETTRDPAGA
jgi:hypothetical protein